MNRKAVFQALVPGLLSAAIVAIMPFGLELGALIFLGILVELLAP